MCAGSVGNSGFCNKKLSKCSEQRFMSQGMRKVILEICYAETQLPSPRQHTLTSWNTCSGHSGREQYTARVENPRLHLYKSFFIISTKTSKSHHMEKLLSSYDHLFCFLFVYGSEVGMENAMIFSPLRDLDFLANIC